MLLTKGMTSKWGEEEKKRGGKGGEKGRERRRERGREKRREKKEGKGEKGGGGGGEEKKERRGIEGGQMEKRMDHILKYGGRFQIKVRAHHQSIKKENQGRIMEVFKLHVASSHVF